MSSIERTPSSSIVSASVRNANELQAALNEAVQLSVEARPEGTSSSYCPKQLKWTKYCGERQFDDGVLVTEAKLLLWLQQSIVPAGNSRKKARPPKEQAAPAKTPKKKGKQKKGKQKAVEVEAEAAAEQQQIEEEANAALSAGTIETYVSAIIDLYRQQVSLGTNPHPSPRGKALKSFLQSLQRDEVKRKRENYEDRHAGTIQDGYSHEILTRINNHYLKDTTISFHASRNRLDHLFGHAILSRGETMRGAQLADLFALPLPNEGTQSCHALVLIMNNGKTNQFGRLEYGGCMRYKEVLECPHAAMGIYLFERFHQTSEPFPSFERREDWYDTWLIRSSTNPIKPLPYRTQYNHMCKVLDDLNIQSSKKTHLNRGGGARRAEDNGASEAQIRRAGKHERDLAAQGFLRLLQYLRITILQDAAALRRTHQHLPILSHPIFASAEFLAFERELIPALDTPEKPVSVAVVEALPELAHFLSSVQNNQIAQSQTIDHLDGRVVKMAKLTQQAFVSISQQIQAVAHKQVKVIVTVQQQAAPDPSTETPFPLLSASTGLPPAHQPAAPPISWTSTSTAPPAAPLLLPSASTTPRPGPPPPTPSTLPAARLLLSAPGPDPSSAPETASFSAAASALALLPSRTVSTRTTTSDQQHQQQDVSEAADSSSAMDTSHDPTFALTGQSVEPTLVPAVPVPSHPIHRLSRSVTSITDVWREWEEGLGFSGVSVKELDRLYGAKWRSSATERKFYSNRKLIYTAVQTLAERQKKTGKEAAAELERRRTILNKSVDWIQKHMAALDDVSLL